MVGDMDAKILAGGWCGGHGRFEDLGAPLSCDCQTCTLVQTDGEIDMVASYEAAAVGEEEE